MKIVLFDTETTGLPVKRDVSPYMSKTNWPDMVSISWILFENSDFVKQKTYIIRPNGWTVAGTEFHGITHAFAEENGDDMKTVLDEFKNDLKGVSYLIAHNLEFDKNVLAHAFFNRLGEDARAWWPSQCEFCTMKKSKDELKLMRTYNGRAIPKYPSLDELYFHTFKEPRPPGAHRADRDTEDLAKIVWKRWRLSDV